MDKKDREEMISLLVLWTGWKVTAFEKLTDRELVRMYDRHYNRQR